MTEIISPEHAALRLRLTHANFRNLKVVDGKFCGLKVENGKTWLYTGLEIIAGAVEFASRSGFDDLSAALASLALINDKPAKHPLSGFFEAPG